MEYKLDIHTHTVSSGHAYSSLEENARAACARGLELIAMTDHTPAMPGGPHIFHFYNMRILPRMIAGVRVLKGAETNIIDYNGSVDLDEEVLEQMELVIASLHPPCIAFGTVGENTRTLVRAMDNPRIHIIGHPGDARYNFDVKEVVAASKATGTLLEINNSSLKPTSSRPGGDVFIRRIFEECLSVEAPIVIGSDAHFSDAVGNFPEAHRLLKELAYPEELILNTSTKRFLDHIGLEA
ncbi:MAG: phosphatase [Spirochaetales bacterium]|nr:phosphatase [Spirochaetales bacterium]